MMRDVTKLHGLTYWLIWSWLPRYCSKCSKWLIPFRWVPDAARKGKDFDFSRAHYCWRPGWVGVHFKNRAKFR